MTDRQTENSNPSVPYDTFACSAGLIITIFDNDNNNDDTTATTTTTTTTNYNNNS